MQRILDILHDVRRSGAGWVARCPCHDDRKPSLSLSLGRDGRILLKCHAGCRTEEVVKALGLDMRDLFPPRSPAKPNQERITKYEIKDADGNLVAIHERHEGPYGKRFCWRLPDGTIGLGGIPTANLPFYGAHKLHEWNEYVVLCEGEKATEALWARSIPAVGTVCGAGVCPNDEALRPLAGKRVILWPDADEAGNRHMEQIAKRLSQIADVHVFTWTGAPKGGDAADWQGSTEELRALLEAAPPWQPSHAIPYRELLAVFQKWLALPSDLPVRFVLSSVIANRLAGDPLWVFLVGPSGDGKTELVNPLAGLDFVRPLDTLTVNTFLSGKQKKDPNASLLLRLPDGAVLLMRDFTAILEIHREKRDEIFSQLRKIYDGHLTRATGEGGESAELSWTGKIGLIACVTPAIEGYRAFATTLGERFLYFYLPTADRLTVAKAARRNRASLQKMRDELKQAVKRFFDGLRIPENVEVPEVIGDWICAVADFVSIARSGVERDWYSSSKEITEIPDPEVPTRLSQQLDLLTCAHAVLMGRARVEPEDLELTRDVALACIPSHRRLIIALLFKAETELTTTDVANAMSLPTQTARRYLEDLAALRLVARRGEGVGEAFLWKLSDFARQGWETLTRSDTRVLPQNAVPAQQNLSELQTSGYEYSNTPKEREESLCLYGDVCIHPPNLASETEKVTASRPSDAPLDDEEPPF